MAEDDDRAAEETPQWIASEVRLNTMISRVMRGVLVVALAMIAAGLVASLLAGTSQPEAVTIAQLVDRLDLPSALLAWGILGLALASGAGLVALIAGWLRRREWTYAAVSLLIVVLLVVAGSLD